MRSDMGLFEPPQEPGSLLRQKPHYWTVRLREEVNAFQSVRASEYEQAIVAANNAAIDGSVPCPGNEIVEQLKQGKARIAKLVETLKGLDAEIHELPESVAAQGAATNTSTSMLSGPSRSQQRFRP